MALSERLRQSAEYKTIGTTIGGVFEDESFTSGVRRRIGRCIGVDLYSRSVDSRNDALMKNPNVRRYMDYPNANPLFGGPNIGEKYSVSENLGEFRDNLDKFGGLLGYTFDIGFGGAGFRYKGNEDTYRNMENMILNEIQVYSDVSFNPNAMLYRVPIGLTRNTSYVSKNPVRNVNDAEEILGRLEQFEGGLGDEDNVDTFGFGPDEQRTRQRLNDAIYFAKTHGKGGSRDYLGKVSNEEIYYGEPIGFDNFGNERFRAKYYALDSIDKISYGSDWGSTEGNGVSDRAYVDVTYLYDEYEAGNTHNVFTTEDKDLSLSSLESGLDEKGLLKKTMDLFKEGKINSLINRFHTSVDKLGLKNVGGSSTDSKYGYSRGRNLRAVNTENSVNGYDNPYCRVWTSHHQYSKVKNLIRPFMNDNGGGNDLATFENIQGKYGNFRPNEGQKRLDAMSSLQTNGFVSIAPHVGPNGSGYNDDVKKCMFSLENLAWKDIEFKSRVDGSSMIKVLGEDQEGPNGGKIMWFPPYNLKFNESTNVNWEGSSFIGRGEQVYTYNNTDRKGTLSFTLLIDHPSVVSRWAAEHANDDGQKRREQELRLLRFFAGCDTTDTTEKSEGDGDEEKTTEQYLAKWNVDAGKEKEEPKAEPQEEKPEPKIEPKTPVSTPEPDPEVEEYRCYVFFPNNLSGYDYLTDGKDVQVVVDYLLSGGTPKTGYEIGTSPINGCIGQDSITGKYGVWKYEVDRGMNGVTIPPVDEKLLPPNYQDRTSFMLNSKISSAVKGENGSVIRALLSLPQDGVNGWDDDRCEKFLISFSDFASKNGGKLSFFEKYYNNEKRRKYTIRFEITGHASSQGHVDKNKELALTRGRFIERLLTDNGIPSNLVEVMDPTVLEVEKDQSVSALKPKLVRSVEIKIKLKPKFEQIPVLPDVLGNNGAILERNVQEILDYNDNNQNTTTEPTQNNIVEGDKKTETKEYHNNPMQEYEYFNIIKETDPVVRQRIIDKVRYFDPAFHSISPEGFNARLTFLQQCTRQGPTTTMSDNRGAEKFAGNMAFGRPPVCVLRIGDFFNTKIIIDSLSIDYDNGGGTQWDLNPEGIGVQPMMANVNIGFTFLGGSDISGPIERLQNAVSSNFYANTSIYDPKADYRDNPIEVNNPTFKAYDPQIIVGADNTRHFEYNSDN